MNSQAIIFHIEPEQIEEVARRIFREMLPACTSVLDEDNELEGTKRRLARIMAKEFITIAEAAFLLSCSEGHVRNLLKKALNRETQYPIPARDLDGLFVFHREELLAWSLEAKTRQNRKRQQSTLTCIK
jgi:hypothetical protein